MGTGIMNSEINKISRYREPAAGETEFDYGNDFTLVWHRF